MTRNVTNQEEVTEYLTEYLDYAYCGNGINQAQVEKCQKWLTTVARNHILAHFPTKPYKKQRGYSEPIWIHAARARGDKLVEVQIGSQKDDELLDKLVDYIAISNISDIARLSWTDAVKQQAAHAKAEKERIKKEKEKWKALGGVLPVCTFSDGMKVVELKTADAVVAEGKRQHNCLTGYGNRVKNDGYRVFSIRTPDDKSLISIGVDEDNDLDDVKETCNKEVQKSNRVYVKQLLARLKVNGHGVFKATKPVAQKPVELLGVYHRGNTELTCLQPGEYKGNVDISHTGVKSLPENSTFHGHIYAHGLNLVIPKSTVIKGTIYR